MKIENKKKVCFLMIDIYCKKKHKTKGIICDECQELKEYVSLKLDKCPFGKTKTFCSNCKIHCYKKDMREKIKEVMRYSSPKLIFHHPILLIKHVILSKGENKNG